MIKNVFINSAILGLSPFMAYACPFCHSDRATEVRQGILATLSDAGFVLSAISPFLVLFSVITILHFDLHQKLWKFLDFSRDSLAKNKETL